MRRKGLKKAVNVDELLDTPAGRRAYEEELLLGAVRSELLPVLERKDMTRQDLADKLDVSLGRISQILSGAENITLKTLAGVGLALELRWEIRAHPAVGAENLIDNPHDEDEDPFSHFASLETRELLPAVRIERGFPVSAMAACVDG